MDGAVETEVRPDVTGQIDLEQLGSNRATRSDLPAGLAHDVLMHLQCATTRVNAQQGRHLRALGLSPSAFALLVSLDAADPGGVQPCTLADELAVTRPSVCGLIDGLEAKGLVARTPHDHDRRRVLVRLTACGERLLDEQRVNYEASERALLRGLSVDEQRQLGRLLERIGSQSPG